MVECNWVVVDRVTRLAKFRNLASFQVNWPKIFQLAFWPFFGLISSWLALTNVFGLLAPFVET